MRRKLHDMTVSEPNNSTGHAISSDAHQISDSHIVQNLPQAVLILSPNGIIERIEGAFELVFHKPRSYFLQRPITDFYFADQMLEILDRLKSGQTIVNIRDMNSLKELPHLEELDISGVPMVDIETFMIVFIPRKWSGSVGDHVTDLSGAVMTIKGLSAMMAHEIKNPLSGIKGAAQLLARKLPDNQLKLTDMVIREVDRVSRLVNDLESFTNPQVGELKQINVHECLDHALDNIKAGIGSQHKFDRHYDPSLPPVMGRFDPLIQIFLNILKNAVEASEPGSRIVVKSRYQHSLWIRDGSGKRRKLPIEICIEDHGTGVDPEIKDHLFDPFITNKEGGSGLGLAMVAQHMMGMGAIIRCEDNEPTGTRMYLHFQTYNEDKGGWG